MKKHFIYFVACVLVPIILVSCNKEGKIIKNAVKDADGNKYDAVKIGDQVWMAENLRTTKYDNGTSIPLEGSEVQRRGLRYYPNDVASYAENGYGYLYDRDVVMNGVIDCKNDSKDKKSICPKGWHVPSRDEWKTALNKAKEIVNESKDSEIQEFIKTVEWKISSIPGTSGYNSSYIDSVNGFSALPMGCFFAQYFTFNCPCSYWTSTPNGTGGTYVLYLYLNDKDFIEKNTNTYYHDKGFFIRCLRD